MTESQSALNGSGWDSLRGQFEALRQEQRSLQTDTAALAERLAKRALSFRDRLQQSHDIRPSLPVILFTAHGSQYAIPLTSVIEIQPLESFSLIPRGPNYLYGVVHFRGMILSLFDLASLLGGTRTGIADAHYYLVAQGAGHRIAIAAGVVEHLGTIPIEEIKLAPEWGSRFPHHWIRGVYRENCLILDLDAILADDQLSDWNQGRAIGP